MDKTALILTNNRGSVIVAALMVLVLLTIIGISASSTSIMEVQISTNSLLHERAFYTAESGVEHVIELLKIPFIQQNTINLATGAGADWSFALVGATDSDADGLGDYDGGVQWINTTLEGVSYTVRIWNNDDGGGPTTDTDGLIFVRSVAQDPRGTLSQIETLIDGNSIAQSFSGYAQEGAGSEKAFVSEDAKAIDFSDANFGQQI